MLDGTPFALEYMNASSVEYMEASEKATEEVCSDFTFLARTQNRDSFIHWFKIDYYLFSGW